MRNLPVAAAAIVVVAFSSAAFSNPPDVRGEVLEEVGIGQAAAEKIFSEAEAAVYFPELGRLRWLGPRGEATLDDFNTALERDFPYFRWSAYGPYILKQPATAGVRPRLIEGLDVGPAATVFTDSFESGLSNWNLDNNTLDLYGWGRTNCSARTGSVSADAIRGGVNTLTCSDPYAPNVVTTMTHNSCEGLAGASQAWVDAWIHVATESGHDTLGFYYDDAAGNGYGYAFSGTWSAWFHVVLNLKQWYRVGDVTTTSCPKLEVQFQSDAAGESGFGARIDDLTVGTSTPTFLACAITAAPASGPAPLTVNFSPTVSGGTSNTAYLWSFGDSAGTTATSRNASFTYTTPGDYVPRLRVEETGIRAYANTTIRVTAATPCTLSCNATVPASGSPGSPVSFAGTATASGCPAAPTYAWTFGDGQSSTLQNPSHAYANAGTYSWSLTVAASGVTCSKNGTISVMKGNSRRRAVGPRGEVILSSQTIGSAGGTVSGGGFTLTVPAGAFSTPANLKLIKGNAANASSGELSGTYILRGMPDRIGAPLRVEIELPGGIPPLAAGEKDYIAVDGYAYYKGKGESTASFPIEATASGKTLAATIPASWTMTSALAVSPAGDALVSTRDCHVKIIQRARHETEHFYVLTGGPPKDAAVREVWARDLLAMLEGNFQKLTTLGFSFNCRVDPASNLFRKIYLEPKALGTEGTSPLGNHVSGKFGGDPCGTNWIFGSDFIEITTDSPLTDNKVKAATAHELFHLLQDIYSPGGPAANLWVKEASSVWFETVVVPGGPCPDVATSEDNVKFPWKGMFNSRNSAVPQGAGGREANHGYGGSAVLKYRTDTSAVLNDPFVRVIWDNIKNGRSEVEAFQTALGSSLPQYWREFAQKFFYGTAPGTCFPSWSSFGSVRIDSQSALPQSTTFPAYPLSARSWALTFTYFQTTTTAVPVVLEARGLAANQSVFVSEVRGKTATPLAELTTSQSRYSIGDLNSKKGAAVIALLVDGNLPAGDPNAQSATNEVTLRFGPEAVYSECIIRVIVPFVPSSPSSPCSYSSTWDWFQGSEAASWTGNTFEFDHGDGDVSSPTVSAKGTVSDDGRTLLSASLDSHSKYTSTTQCREGVTQCVAEEWMSARLTNVLASATWKPTEYNYGAEGTAARPKITWSWHRVRSGFYPTADNPTDMDCTYQIDESKIRDLKIEVRATRP